MDAQEQDADLIGDKIFGPLSLMDFIPLSIDAQQMDELLLGEESFQSFVTSCEKIVSLEVEVCWNAAESIMMSSVQLFGQNYKLYQEKLTKAKKRKWYTSVADAPASPIADLLRNHLCKLLMSFFS